MWYLLGILFFLAMILRRVWDRPIVAVLHIWISDVVLLVGLVGVLMYLHGLNNEHFGSSWWWWVYEGFLVLWVFFLTRGARKVVPPGKTWRVYGFNGLEDPNLLDGQNLVPPWKDAYEGEGTGQAAKWEKIKAAWQWADSMRWTGILIVFLVPTFLLHRAVESEYFKLAFSWGKSGYHEVIKMRITDVFEGYLEEGQAVEYRPFYPETCRFWIDAPGNPELVEVDMILESTLGIGKDEVWTRDPYPAPTGYGKWHLRKNPLFTTFQRDPWVLRLNIRQVDRYGYVKKAHFHLKVDCPDRGNASRTYVVPAAPPTAAP